ncbi:bifunctional DNA primase/polymerase [Streptomyces sp. NPDC004327]|uniref:bifunctional DNA primase/polymerase n=1 Tax=Streptomyces sp. NPDC004327 TaxID=3364699 RepID=UPI00367CA11C
MAASARRTTAAAQSTPPSTTRDTTSHSARDTAPSTAQLAALALAHALTAAEHGLPVFPLSRSKLPALRSPHRGEHRPVPCRGECGLPGHGVYDATTDPEAVRALFAAAPWATGYGIACGRAPHRLIGVDLDVKEPDTDGVAALDALARRHGFALPRTVTVLTPGGGRHLWLTGPPDTVVPNSAGRLAPGIDIRGAGGYLAGPGSTTPRGAYRLAPDTADLPPAPCPPWLLALLAPAPPPDPARAPSRARGPHRAQALLDFVAASPRGQRNTRLFWAACRMYENGLTDRLLAPLTTAALATGLTGPEIDATLASAASITGLRPQSPENANSGH